MKKAILKSLLFISIFSSSAFAEIVNLPSSSIDIDSGSFWIRNWTMNDQKDKANLKTITGYESSLLLTFSGADYTYLNQQAATQFKSLGNNVYEWTFEDNKVLYKRVYDLHDHIANISIASFRIKITNWVSIWVAFTDFF